MRWIAVALWLALPAPALADAPCPDEAGAREAFLEARRLGEQRQLSAAREAYERSLEACARIPTAYNLAVVLLQLGEPVAAGARARTLLTGELGALDPAQRAAAEAIVVQADGAMGTIQVAVQRGTEVSVAIDGGESVPVRPDGTLALRVDPGAHRVVARDADGRSVVGETRVASGAEVSLELTLPPPLEPASEAYVPVRRRPQLWFAVGAVVVAVALTVGLVVRRRNTSPVEDDVWGRADLPLVSF